MKINTTSISNAFVPSASHFFFLHQLGSLTRGRTLKYIPPLWYKWVVGLLGACDVTNNGRHRGRHLVYYQESEIRLKPREMLNFCAWHEK